MLSLAYSNTDDEGLPYINLGTGVKTPLYTQMVANQGFISFDSSTVVGRVGMAALGGNFGLAYGYSDVMGSDYKELDLTYKTKVFNDSTTLFAGYVYQDDDRMDDTQNMLRFWAKYNF